MTKKAKRQAQSDPLKLKGKRIKVKWYDEGPLTAKAESQRGKQGKYFQGKVIAYNSTKKVYRITYDDDLDGVYETNLTESQKGNFIPQANWKAL